MKIAIGYKLNDGPWGGGNQFAISLKKKLIEKGHEVFFNLSRDDLDIILLTDPRKRSPCVSFSSGDIIKYLIFKNSKALVIHRINECDERKKTFHMNFLLRIANYSADHTVFIASWLKDLNLTQKNVKGSVILNGGNNRLFNLKNNITWNKKGPLKIVTHHWGGNYMKGFDIYNKLDILLSNEKLKKKINFTYIGNLPKNISFSNTKHIRPLYGKELANELSKHHVYLTASINEPAGMHHIEGALSGLPLIYRKSGALPEYCSGYGLQFIKDDFLRKINLMRRDYSKFKKIMKKYPHTSDEMSSKYILLFENLLKDKEKIINRRKIYRNPFQFLVNILFL